MINMIVRLTALMVVYQTIPILIRSPPPVGFGGDASGIAQVQLPYMIVSFIFSVASGFIVSKFGNVKPTTIGTIITSVGFFILFMFHSTEASIAAALILVAIGLAFDADRFSECRVDININTKAIQWSIIGDEFTDISYRCLGRTSNRWNIYASNPGIYRV